MFSILIASVRFKIYNKYTYVYKLCQDYMVDSSEEDIAIDISEKEIYLEQYKKMLYMSQDIVRVYVYTEKYLHKFSIIMLFYCMPQ